MFWYNNIRTFVLQRGIKMEEQLIFHVDVNSAFLSWEAVYRLYHLGEKIDLRTIPSAVGGDEKKRHGIILAKSIPCKPYKIQTAETISSALKKCPNLVLVPPRYELYEQCSKAFINILQQYSPVVEQYSIDEVFCDMTGTKNLYGTPIVLANIIKDKIKSELGFTVNIGISTNKILAKMASDFIKPDRVHTLYPDEIKKKMWHLPIRDLFYVGNSTEKKLKQLGINTIGQLANTDITIIRRYLKKHGELIHHYANGIDITPIDGSHRKNKGYGNSTTIPYDVDNKEAAKLILLSLCETVCTRLRADGVTSKCISLEITDYDFNHTSHQMTLLSPSNRTNEIHSYICKLFDEVWDKVPIRKLGVHTSKISDTTLYQYNLFDQDRNLKLSKLDEAIDIIRSQYGSNSIIRASFLNSDIKHMHEGKSPLKRNADVKQSEE